MRKEMFEELLQSIREMKEIEAGRLKPARITSSEEILSRDVRDVAALRQHFGLSQRKFAALLGISVGTLQNWEQGRRQPEGPARVLLRVAAAHPEAVLDVAKVGQVKKAGRVKKAGQVVGQGGSRRARRGRARSGQAP
ncbi:MAG: helix-turn-helix domain-containing protein [Gemmatimonadaceae bacterium]|nr:helix-turn-helix domain-containing protein [Gemmatimonadaceae bacterium]MCW5825418.1 helix-turn-helix domain-containing protein [Gemmatimonadaceae bacterium]